MCLQDYAIASRLAHRSTPFNGTVSAVKVLGGNNDRVAAIFAFPQNSGNVTIFTLSEGGALVPIKTMMVNNTATQAFTTELNAVLDIQTYGNVVTSELYVTSSISGAWGVTEIYMLPDLAELVNLEYHHVRRTFAEQGAGKGGQRSTR